jgi:hypothetical protein
MEVNQSVEFFLRFLNERFKVFREALTEFERKLVLMDHGAKVAAGKSLLQAIDDLKRSISESDRPRWISSLENPLRHYVAQHGSNAEPAYALLGTIIRLSPEIDAQKWDFSNPSTDKAIDFSTIFREAFQASRVPQLLDELIGHIQAIVDSGAIDSMRVVTSLEELIALIRKNRQGDILSTGTLWEVTKTFFVNLGLEGLESIPVVKQTVKALRKTLADLDLEMGHLYGSVKQTLIEKTSTQLPMLDYTPSQQLALPEPPRTGTLEQETGPSASGPNLPPQ